MIITTDSRVSDADGCDLNGVLPPNRLRISQKTFLWAQSSAAACFPLSVAYRSSVVCNNSGGGGRGRGGGRPNAATM